MRWPWGQALKVEGLDPRDIAVAPREKEDEYAPLRSRMKEALQYLPIRQSLALEHELAGEEVDETSRSLKASNQAVYDLRHRAKKRVTEQFEHEDWLKKNKDEALRLLPKISRERNRLIVEMYLDGCSYPDIGERLGLDGMEAKEVWKQFNQTVAQLVKLVLDGRQNGFHEPK